MLEILLRLLGVGFAAGAFAFGSIAAADYHRFQEAYEPLASSLLLMVRGDLVDMSVLLGLGVLCWAAASGLTELFYLREQLKDPYEDHPKMSKSARIPMPKHDYEADFSSAD